VTPVERLVPPLTYRVRDAALAVTVARDALAAAVAERDHSVYQLAEAGASYAQIAAALGVSRQRVGQYVAAHQARRGRG